MTRPYLAIILVMSVTGTLVNLAHAGQPTAPADSQVTHFHNIVRLLAIGAQQQKRTAIPGTDGWMFFVPELRALTVGPFWGDRASAVSRASNKRYADPLEPIADFHRQLKRAEIRLLVVPVPAKVAVYPERVAQNISFGPSNARGKTSPPRLDIHHQAFHKLLVSRGVEVVDLLPEFLEQRHDRRGPLYCKTDTHWSGRGVDVATAAILKSIGKPKWLRDLPLRKSISHTQPVTITGDLARTLDADKPVRETLPLTFVGRAKRRGRPVPTPVSRTSPVLVMGDSHALVFHDPTLHAAGAGLPDHIAAGLGLAVDLIAARGSGATATRISLLRRRDNLKGKKLVIWCFSIREYTESFSGWRTVPVIRR